MALVSSQAAFEGRDTPQRPLPSGYSSVGDILDRKVSINSLVSVIGIVKSFRGPFPSNGQDHKMVIQLFDKSVDHMDSSIPFNIFASLEAMPQVNIGDMMHLQLVKVLDFQSVISLISNRASSIFVFDAAKMPAVPEPANVAQKPVTICCPTGQPPSKNAHEYVTWLFHNIDKAMLPSVQDIKAQEVKLSASAYTRRRFALLQDAHDGYFDLLVMVVTKPQYFPNSTDRVSLWVTDFTRNDAFRNFPWPEGVKAPLEERNANAANAANAAVNDPFGYTHFVRGGGKAGGKAEQKKVFANWLGPYGKLCLEVTCFEPHASFIMSHVPQGSWMRLRNVRIKLDTRGFNGFYGLEGMMNRDGTYPEKINVTPLTRDPNDTDKDSIDPKWLEAMTRKHRYECQAKPLLKQAMRVTGRAVPGAGAGAGAGAGKAKAKTRRNARRALERQLKGLEGGHGGDGAQRSMPAANMNVTSDHANMPVTPLSTVLVPIYHAFPATKGGPGGHGETTGPQLGRVMLPFANIKFRAQVRVVDFRSSRLEDFAVARRVSDYDMLGLDIESNSFDTDGDAMEDSDDDVLGYGLSSSNGGGGGDGTLDAHVGPVVWQWRFALLLEDATSAPTSSPVAAPPPRIWAVVDNADAEMLTGLSACDLRKEAEYLSRLRETLFILWGELEERKTRAWQAARAAQRAANKEAELRRKKLKQRQEEEERKRDLIRETAARALLAQQKSLPRYQAIRLPSISDDEQEDNRGAGTRTKANAPVVDVAMTDAPPAAAAASSTVPDGPLLNIPFQCCIQQYGIRVRERVPGGADSGRRKNGRGGVGGDDGNAVNDDDESSDSSDEESDSRRRRRYRKVWKRVFGLFGTKIARY